MKKNLIKWCKMTNKISPKLKIQIKKMKFNKKIKIQKFYLRKSRLNKYNQKNKNKVNI